MNINTPRTDSAAREIEKSRDYASTVLATAQSNGQSQFVTSNFARTLERELAAALARVRELEGAMRPDNNLRKTVLLRDYSEIIDHLQLCQDKEDIAAGDMGHSYFGQTITAIQDLEALVMDLTKCDPALVMKPLRRPDKAGHWWLWMPEKGRWDYLIVEHPTYMQNGKWLPATPPPPPSKEGNV